MPTPNTLILLYVVHFAIHGIVFPYLPVALKGLAFTPSGVSAVMSLMLGLQMISPPFWGYLADRFNLNARLMLIAAAGGTAGMTLAAGGSSDAAFMAGALVYAFFRTPVAPLLDALTLAHPKIGMAGYGGIRRWGSAGFVVGVYATGFVLDSLTPRQIPGLAAVVCALLFGISVVLGLGSASLPVRPGGPQFRRLYGQGRVWAFLAMAALHHGCGVPFDSFFAIHAKEVGLPGGWVGAAWAMGVTVEVIVLTKLDGMVRWAGPKKLIAFAICVAALRWTLTAAIPGGVALALVQSVHGITFGLAFGAGVVWMSRAVPDELRASAQSIYAATVWGGGGIIGQLISGQIFEKFGGRALFGTAAVVEIIALIALMTLAEPEEEKSPSTD